MGVDFATRLGCSVEQLTKLEELVKKARASLEKPNTKASNASAAAEAAVESGDDAQEPEVDGAAEAFPRQDR